MEPILETSLEISCCDKASAIYKKMLDLQVKYFSRHDFAVFPIFFHTQAMLVESQSIFEESLKENRVKLSRDIAELKEKLVEVEQHGQASLDEFSIKRRQDLKQIHLGMSRDMQRAFQLISRIQRSNNGEDCEAEMSELAQIQANLDSIVRVEDREIIQNFTLCLRNDVFDKLKHLSLPELVKVKSNVKAQDIKLIVKNENGKLALILLLFDSSRNLSPMLHSDLWITIGGHFNQTDLKSLVNDGQVLRCFLKSPNQLDIILPIEYSSRGAVQVMMYGEHVDNSPWTDVPDLEQRDGFCNIEKSNGVFKRNKAMEGLDQSDIRAMGINETTIDPNNTTLMENSRNGGKNGKVSFHHQVAIL